MPKSSDSDSQRTRQKWNARFRDRVSTPAAARVLLDNQHLLPASGRALDLACGLGGNALLLAEHGLETHAWDISDVAVARLQERARQQGLSLHAEARDVTRCPPTPERFEVIVVSRFLERELAPVLIEALTLNGLLFYQTFTRNAVDAYGPPIPAYRLAEQELLSLFCPLQLLVYREEGRVGDIARGWRNEAMFVGQKTVHVSV
ncbi:MAG: class I SAM-dependent methyltransferase [Candidatus Tectomicrobia bacterium]|nr:class I SAM-dependent methyltransferase [Candidatus Tectomicrobia bacterium]